MRLNAMYNLNSILSTDYSKISDNTRVYLCTYNIINEQLTVILEKFNWNDNANNCYYDININNNNDALNKISNWSSLIYLVIKQ